MPAVDLKLHELKEYMGCSPMPGDFNEYWAEALKELDNQGLEYQLVKADFQVKGAECFHLYFTGVGGAKVHAKFMRPSHIKEKAPAIAIFHGYQGHSRDWFEKLPFVFSGFVVAALDARGQAGLSQDNLSVSGSTFRGHIVRGLDEDNPHKLAFRQIFLDTVQLVRILQSMEYVDGSKIGTAGFSQGGALSFACSALSGIVNRSAVGCPFLADYKRVWDMDLGGVPYEELRLYFRLRDPMHQKFEHVFERLGYIDIQNLAPMLKNEVRFYVGLVDRICPPSTQFAAYNKITSKKSMLLYPDFDHEEFPGSWEDILLYMLEMQKETYEPKAPTIPHAGFCFSRP